MSLINDPTPTDISGLSPNIEPVDLYVSAFNQNVTLTQLASLLSVSPESLSGNVNATYTGVSLSAFRDAFQFSSNDAVLLADPNGNVDDLHFYVVDDKIASLAAPIGSECIVTAINDGKSPTIEARTGASLVDGVQQVAQEYLRYLAGEIFGTYMGVDLIYNETAMVNDISGSISRAWNTGVAGFLHTISTTGSNGLLEVDASYGLYFDNADPSGAYPNVSQTMFNQMMAANPARFAVTANGIEDTSAPQPLPFQEDDTVSFVVTLNAAPGQEDLVHGDTSIAPRTYVIKLVLSEE